MKLTQKFNLTALEPMAGARGGIWFSLKPQEVADAEAAGVGPSVPDASGTPVPGTIVPGELIQLNASGNVEPGTPATLGVDFAKVYLVVFSGDDDRSGSFVGDVLCIHGGARVETERYDAGAYVIGRPLVASGVTAGNFAQKAAVGDNIQAMAWVGPAGLANGVLDIILPQGGVPN